MKKISFLVETLAGMGLLWVINLFLYPRNPGFVGIAPHPYLYLLVLITIRYGYARGAFCLFAVAASYFLSLLATGTKITEIILLPLASFVVFITLVGLVTDYYLARIKKGDEQTGTLTRLTSDLKEERDQLKVRNEELSQRLMAEKSTFAILYRSARKLSTLDLDELLTGIIELADKVIGAGNCAVFFLEGRNLVLRKAKNRETVKADCPGNEILNRVLKEKKIFSVKDILAEGQDVCDEVFLCGPLLAGSGGEPAGIILLQELDFLKYNPATIRVFTLLCDWMSIAYANILLHKAGAAVQDSGKLQVIAAADFTGIFEYGADADSIRERVHKVCVS